jgi:hypothetical protein
MKPVFLAFGAAGFFVSLVRKNIYSISVGLAFAMLLFASNQGMYPVVSRLWLFTYVFCIMYTVYFIAHIRVKCEKEKIVSVVVAAGFSAALLAGNASFPSIVRGGTDEFYPGMNVNPLIAYVEENIREGETLYSFETANPILWFKNGYMNRRIGDVTEDNIVFGTPSMSGDFYVIEALESTYILYNRGYIPYSQDKRIIQMNTDLETIGYVDRVLDVNYTPLYWFTTDINSLRTAAEIEIAGESAEGMVIIKITNTGETILETAESAKDRGITGQAELVLCIYEGDVLAEERVLAELPAPLLPGETAEVEVVLAPGLLSAFGKAVIDLESAGRFKFSEIGMNPIEVGDER